MFFDRLREIYNTSGMIALSVIEYFNWFNDPNANINNTFGRYYNFSVILLVVITNFAYFLFVTSQECIPGFLVFFLLVLCWFLQTAT